ncbi:hypothetical protein SAY86_000251 [Trapa natans]|uniref:Uncharacterized protein n=1 Tax=Trapa natans TaxID=22666 RepID=A0AAN7M3Q3_TRANT|nr:hypothetical protein SAY86_000251 [Trapa natans]
MGWQSWKDKETGRGVDCAFSDDIPFISLHGIDDESGAGRAEICRKIVEACEDWGGRLPGSGPRRGHEACGGHDKARQGLLRLSPEEKLRFDMSGGNKGGFTVSSHLQDMVEV